MKYIETSFENFKMNESSNSNDIILGEVKIELKDRYGLSEDEIQTKLIDFKPLVDEYIEKTKGGEIEDISDDLASILCDTVYGVEFRDMSTAIHNVVTLNDKKDATDVYDAMKNNTDDIWDWLESSGIDYDVEEINFRNIVERDGQRYTDDELMCNIINETPVPDLY
jgi:hypothetical protein